MKRILTIFIFLFYSTSQAIACDCQWTFSFCETVKNYALTSAAPVVIVHAVVHKITEGKIDFKIIQTLNGESNNGDHFHYLEGYIFNFDEFDNGEEYIFALSAPLSEPQSHGMCDTYYLPIKNGKIIGKINGELDELSIAAFLKLANCGIVRPSLELTPTILTGQDWMAIPKDWFYPISVDIRLFNAAGQLLYEKGMEEYAGETPITIGVEGLAAGLYFCQISFWGKSETTKVIKLN